MMNFFSLLFFIIFCFLFTGCELKEEKEQPPTQTDSWFMNFESIAINDNKQENNESGVIDNPLHKFVVYKIWKTYPITRGGNSLFKDIFERYVINTNDPNRNIESIPCFEAIKDIKSYKCFYCEEWWEKTQYFWEDKDNLFLYYNSIAASKENLPSFFPLQETGKEAVIAMIGYSSGYIIQFPFKFPVDWVTFRMVQEKNQLQRGERKDIPELETVSDGLRRPKFQNRGLQYDKYVGDDKDYIYLRNISGPDSLDRIKKESDFKILKKDEVWNIISRDSSIWLAGFTWEVSKDRNILYEEFGGNPWFYYSNNKVYISRYGHWIRSFPIDWATMKREEKEFQEEGKEHPTSYNRLSDKDWWYQLIYHIEWDYYEVQRVKK